MQACAVPEQADITPLLDAVNLNIEMQGPFYQLGHRGQLDRKTTNLMALRGSLGLKAVTD